MALQIPISTDEITIKYRQPYVSEALNRKGKADDGGVVRGFNFKKNNDPLAPNTIILDVDEQTSDSVMNIVNQNKPEFSLTWNREFPLVITVPNVAGYQHLFVNHGYVFGDETIPTITWYTTAEVSDDQVVNEGMYIGSVEGQTFDVKTTFQISQSKVLKRATASARRGARGRVASYDENLLFQTDFNDQSNTPLDLTKLKPNRCHAVIANSTNLSVLDSLGAEITKIKPESNDSVLLFWRTNNDATNDTNQDDLNVKRFVLPHFIPCNSQWVDDDDYVKISLALRIAGLRSTTRLPSETLDHKWRVKLNVSTNQEKGTFLGTLIDSAVETLSFVPDAVINNVSDPMVIDPLAEDNGLFPWSWVVGEVRIPSKNANGKPINVQGFSVEIIVPNMGTTECFAIDRLVVDGENIALVSPFDSTHNLGGTKRLGIMAKTDNFENARPTLLSSALRGYNIAPDSSWSHLYDDRPISTAIANLGHSVNIGLPALDENNPGRLESNNVSNANVSYEYDANTPAGYDHLLNLFRQSSLNIYAPGQYEVKELVDHLRSINGNIGTALVAPYRAGVIVHNGNVNVLESTSRIEDDLTTSDTKPSHLTGYVISSGLLADSDYVERGTYNLDTGVVTSDYQDRTIDLVSRNPISQVFSQINTLVTVPYGTALSRNSAFSFTTNTLLSIAQGLFSPSNEVNTVLNTLGLHDFTHYCLLFGDPRQYDRGADSGVAKQDSPLIGIRQTLKKRVLGEISMDDFVSQDNLLTGGTLPLPSQTQSVGFDRSLSKLTLGRRDVVFDSNALNYTDDAGGQFADGVRLYLGLKAYQGLAFGFDPISGLPELVTDENEVYRFQDSYTDSPFVTNLGSALTSTFGSGNFRTETFTECVYSHQNPLSDLPGVNDHNGRYRIKGLDVHLWGKQGENYVNTATSVVVNDNDMISGFGLGTQHLLHWLYPLKVDGTPANLGAGLVGLRYQRYMTQTNAPNYPFTSIPASEAFDDTEFDRYPVQNTYLRFGVEVFKRPRAIDNPNSSTDTMEIGTVVAHSEVLVNLYEYVAGQLGLVNASGQFVRPTFSNGDPMTDTQVFSYIVNAITHGVTINYDILNSNKQWSVNGDPNTKITRLTTDQLNARLLADGEPDDILDPSKYSHRMYVSTMFVSSYGTKTYSSHPICSAPAVNHFNVLYQDSSL